MSGCYVLAKRGKRWLILVHGAPFLECDSFEQALETATAAARLLNGDEGSRDADSGSPHKRQSA
jgi:hypothetical protein